MNECLWIFNIGALPLKAVHDSFLEIMKLDFNTYICGHRHKEYSKDQILLHMQNLENLKVDDSTISENIGFTTYTSTWENSSGKSEIVFTKDLV